jgi:hypothetical protein
MHLESFEHFNDGGVRVGLVVCEVDDACLAKSETRSRFLGRVQGAKRRLTI